MQKRNAQVTSLLVVIVGMMMVFLFPSLIEEAQARTVGNAFCFTCTFTDVEGQMVKGVFDFGPVNRGPDISWVTQGGDTAVGGGDEVGFIRAHVGSIEQVHIFFSNPAIGHNSCSVFTSSPNLNAGCQISEGVFASLNVFVFPKVRQNTANNYCDILTELGNLEQTKIIREKLNC